MADNLYYFGIDGGGTHSRLAVTDSKGAVLARADAGSTNIYSIPKEKIFENLSYLLNSAMKTAGIEKQYLAAGCIGSAGLGRAEEQKLFREFFDSLLGPDFPVKICTDGEILLCGGLGGLEGYCLIAGTGSIALGRTMTGNVVRSGGHGYMLGDEGSAAWIGKTAIARCLRSLEKRDLPTDMMDAILKGAGLTRPDDLIRYVHHDADKVRIAALAPLVTAAARAGDSLAMDILRAGAVELTLLVRSVLVQSPQIKRRELVLAGGVIEHNEILTNELKKNLSCEFPDLALSSPQGTALEGACMIAAAIGVTIINKNINGAYNT